MLCPNCKMEAEDASAECSYCGLVFAKWRARAEAQAAASAQAAAPAQAAPTAASLAAEAAVAAVARRPSRTGLSLEAWLLILAFPIVIPSLIVNFVMAKRWGRIDFALIAVDALVIALFCMRSPLMLFLVFIAWVASGLLWGLRRDKLEYGIFLGYSNTVATFLIIGGILAGIGAFSFLPWGRAQDIVDLLFSGRREASVEKIVEFKVRLRSPRKVELTDAKPLWDDRFYRSETGGGVKYYSHDPRKPLEVRDARELWDKREDLVGSRVRLSGTPEIVSSVDRENVEFSTASGGERGVLEGLRKFSAVEPEGRVWLLNDESGPVVEGRLEYSYADGSLGRLWQSQFQKPLPYMAVTIRPDPGQEAPAVGSLETWVPMAGSRHGLWLVLPGDAAGPPSAPVQGIYVGRGWAGPELSDVVQERFDRDIPLHGDYHAVLARSPLEHIRQEQLIERFRREIDFEKLFFLLPGLALLAAAIWFAMKE